MYVNDSPAFIKKVRDIQEDSRDTILVYMDMKSLYTNSYNHEGVEAGKENLNAQTDKPKATKVIIKFLSLILTLNWTETNEVTEHVAELKETFLKVPRNINRLWI